MFYNFVKLSVNIQQIFSTSNTAKGINYKLLLLYVHDIRTCHKNCGLDILRTFRHMMIYLAEFHIHTSK